MGSEMCIRDSLYPSPRPDLRLCQQSSTSSRCSSWSLLGWEEPSYSSIPAPKLGPHGIRRRRHGRARGPWRGLGRSLCSRDDLPIQGSRVPHRRNRGQRSRKFYRGRGRLEWQILDLERLWGRPPGWFYSQSKSSQADLLGWYRVHIMPEKPKKPSKSSRSILQGIEGSDEAKAWFLGD